MNHTCPSGQVVSSIASLYSKSKKDRLWGISCQAFKPVKTCSWSSYKHDSQGEIDFRCADNEVIAGVISGYSKSKMDRSWKFYCCSFSDFTTINPTETPAVNDWREYFEWSVPSSTLLTGVKGVFDARHE
ncbi:hemagglutinin/amebocyte aggregation factor-like [Chaetodon trifascialis]|uniref:hemagglutinin/amebocyte aggregation factor-like n=1 Tax=Chaetodon trifascialis TaxID=109706 RepID=UPI003992CC2E